MLRLAVAALLLAACWRGATAPAGEPEPFVARLNAVAELRHATDALPARLDIVEQRVLGLVSELERDAVRQDLVDLAQDVVTLRSYAASLRKQGGDPGELDSVTHKLTRVAEAIAELREELVYAHTLAEQRALLQQSADGNDDPENAAAPVRRRVLVRRPVTAEPILQDDSLVLPPFTRRQPVRRELP